MASQSRADIRRMFIAAQRLSWRLPFDRAAAFVDAAGFERADISVNGDGTVDISFAVPDDVAERLGIADAFCDVFGFE